MATRSPRVKVEPVPTKQFRDLIRQQSKRMKALLRVAKVVYSQKKSGEIPIGGEPIATSDISAWMKSLDKEMGYLGRVYTAAFNRKRAGGQGRGGPNSGFRLPLVINDNLIRFFQEANLGDVVVGGQSYGRVQDHLPFLRVGDPLYGIANRSLLTSLFSLYAKVNNLSDLSNYNRDAARVQEPDYKNRQILGADALMNRHLGVSFEEIRRASTAKLAAMGVQDGERKPLLTKSRTGGPGRTRHYFSDFRMVVGPDGKKIKEYTGRHPIWLDYYHAFNPQNFTYGNFQQIILANSFKTADLGNDPRVGLLGKVNPDAAKAYQQSIEAARNSDSQLKFEQFAVAAGGGNELLVRAALDQAFSLVQATLQSIPKVKSR